MLASARGHHHATADGVDRVRSQASDGGDGPAEKERRKEAALERTYENDGLWM